jgi:acyl-CoA synthetase (AMP-forming)/AMP-acid ligase II
MAISDTPNLQQLNTASGSTLHGLLRERAEAQPEDVAYTFFDGVKSETETQMTFSAVDAAARAVASALTAEDASGRRVLLAHASARHYISGLFGCLYAGAVPVSAMAPEPVRPAATLGHLEAIRRDAGAELALCSTGTREWMSGREDAPPLRWVATDELPPADVETTGFSESADIPAYIQYTSGSTERPKGVELSHANFLANLEVMRELCAMGSDSVIASWLPLFHDMGLVGPVLHPLYLGCRTAFISPVSFLLRPVRWLGVISSERATITGGPNFAFDLVAERTTFDQRAGLDLSSWTHAINGAEPIRPDTLRRFERAFAPVGYRAQTMAPALGMAEATCMVTGSISAQRPLLRSFVRRDLGEGLAVDAAGAEEDVIELVGCGVPAGGHRVLIVDPDERAVLEEGRVGEVWVSGPSVARGYVGQLEQSAAMFKARLSDGEGPFLRTGDLGFQRAGETFVVGRIKELVIVRGQNHLPHDLERTAAASNPLLAANGTAAFSIVEGGEEQLVIVQELSSLDVAEVGPIIESIRDALVRDHGIKPAATILIPPGSLPKTPTGKIRRAACRDLYREGGLEAIPVAERMEAGL